MTDQVLIEWKKLFWVELYPFVFIAKKQSSRCNSSLHKKIYVIKKISKNKPNNEHDKISYFCEKVAIAHNMYPLIARHLRKSHFMSNLQIHVFCKWLSCSLQRSDWWYCLLADWTFPSMLQFYYRNLYQDREVWEESWNQVKMERKCADVLKEALMLHTKEINGYI